jgi:competence protein ComEC
MGGFVAGAFHNWALMRVLTRVKPADLEKIERPASVALSPVLWAPVALTAGIWAYFALPIEPSAIIALLFTAAAIATIYLSPSKAMPVLLALALFGFAAAKARTEWVRTPLLSAATDELVVIGLVRGLEMRSANRYTMLFQPTSIEGFAHADLPRRITLSGLLRHGKPAIGERIAVKARMFPLQGPVIPGGFDYGRQQYFSGIGGTGRMTAGITRLSLDVAPGLFASRALADLREAIGQRIFAALDPVNAAVAQALITGERASIPREVNQSFQVSGLAHILSISGLHMSLAAGGVYWLVRALLALSQRAALRWPIKKIAAAAALVFGFFYMELAGADPATLRSYIMIAVVFFAILVDRPAISLRNLALAAILILLIEPESAVQASFQMSFMAVLGLAAMYEWWGRWQGDAEFRIESRLSRLLRKALSAALLSILTSLVAGTFSSVPAAYHFGRVAPYGVLANGLAIPVVSLLVMPSALATVIAIPFGLERWPLAVMGQGIDLVLAISDWVKNLPGASNILPQMPIAAAVVIALALVLFCLSPNRWKLTSLPVGLVGLALLFPRASPDILIDRTASAVAFRNAEGELVPTQSRPSSFATSKWLQADGEEITPKQASARQGWACDSIACRAEVKGKKLIYVKAEPIPKLICANVDILVAAVPLRGACSGVAIRIDRFDVWRNGAHALSIDGDAIVPSTAAAEQGQRPWVVQPKPRRKTLPGR